MARLKKHQLDGETCPLKSEVQRRRADIERHSEKLNLEKKTHNQQTTFLSDSNYW